MDRIGYFLRRILLVIPTFLGITAVCFLITQFVPGGPVEQAIMQMRGLGSGDIGATSDTGAAISDDYRKQLEIRFGFDQPLHKRYVKWLVTDRLGMRMDSYRFPNRTAWEIIASRFPVSLAFGITGFLLTYLICIPLGISKALRDGSVFDFASSSIVFIGYAIPAFAFGMLLKMAFCGTVDWMFDIFPVAGFHSEGFVDMTFSQKASDLLMHMFLPVLCYVIGNFAVLTLLMKNSLLDQVGADYVRTVLARGGTPARAIWGHALRNSLIPIATGFGSILSLILAGSVIVEQVFEIPGMGRLSLEAIVGRDYAVFMGIVSLTSILALCGNIISDLCYVLIDPRITFDK